MDARKFLRNYCEEILQIKDRQVQKSDQINSDRQSGSDQLGSTRIASDHEKNIKFNIIERLKFQSKMDQIKKDSRRFSIA